MTIERLLIVDDEEDMLKGLSRTLGKEFKNLETVTTTRATEAINLIQQEPFDLALLDIRMPEMDGLELSEKLREKDPSLTIIIMTAYASIELAVDAIRRGAYDFITKPFDKDDLFRAIRKGLERNQLVRENLTLKEIVCQKEAFANFIGQSQPMRRFYEQLKTIAPTEYTVLIRGESGTGKELAARAIHNLSKRRHLPLVVVNCPAIPEHLLESELFGHRRGAFTGADRDQRGMFEEADGGTICLDEIGDIPVSLQTKLLRVLQEQEIKPLGAAKTRKIDVRIIAITNQNLEQKIKDRTFREDLFHRLNVVNISPPTLAEIKEDIPLLISHFARQVCCELNLQAKRFSNDAVEALMARAWPGNVRELQNVIRQAIMFSPTDTISIGDLETGGGNRKTDMSFTPPSRNNHTGEIEPYKAAKERLLAEFADYYVSTLLDQTGGNVTKAAQLSGLTRAAFQKIMRRATINSEDYR